MIPIYQEKGKDLIATSGSLLSEGKFNQRKGHKNNNYANKCSGNETCFVAIGTVTGLVEGPRSNANPHY
jgi:hypothetical protein